jgi:CRISPR-associated protein Csd1
MLVQALAQYADTYLPDQLEDPAFESKPVPLMLEISPKGRFLGWIDREETITRGKKIVRQIPSHEVPRSPVNRNTGIHPLLAFDDAKYVFGPAEASIKDEDAATLAKLKKKYEHEKLKHEAFVKFLQEAVVATDDEALRACVRFYEQPDQVAKARESFNPKVTGGILLSVPPHGPVVLREAVKAFWRDHYAREFAARNKAGGEGMCLISGKVGPIAPTHDKIKGTASLGGQPAGVSLMSFDKEAFQSFGWEQNANSPVSPGRAQAYVLALNDLLARRGTNRVDHKDTAFLFWLRKPQPEFNPMEILEQADPDSVRRLLEIRAEGWRSIEPNEFYLLAVTGNGGRLVVRQWMQESLETVLSNVAAWFEGLAIIDAFSGQPAPPPKMWQLLSNGVLARDEPPSGCALDFTRRALHGQPLGLAILAAALSRIRIEKKNQKLNATRAGLIRLAVNDAIKREQKGESLMDAELNENEKHQAYLCGRLLAMFDGLQYASSGPNVNQTVADRYYTLASTYPRLAFPKIEDLGMKHLRKLRRDKPGAAIRIEREMDEVRDKLSGVFPGPLNLVDQGRFALGFHHQRADSIKRATEAKQSRKGDQE